MPLDASPGLFPSAISPPAPHEQRGSGGRLGGLLSGDMGGDRGSGQESEARILSAKHKGGTQHSGIKIK